MPEPRSRPREVPCGCVPVVTAWHDGNEDMDTRHLRAAVAVARHRSFTRAAEELFMSQSTVTRQIATLERELGHQLFLRSARTVDLTDRGRVFLPKAQQVLEVVDLALREIRN